jgi:general secretion pathway protein F
MNYPEPTPVTITVASEGAAWRLSPLLPLELNQDRQLSLLSILAVAHSQQIPLVPLLKAFATEHRFWFRHALFHLSKRLDAGESLSTALMRTPSLLSQGTVLAIHSAKNDEALSHVYSTLLAAGGGQSNASSIRIVGTVLYWMTFAIPAIVVMSGIGFFIIPTFIRMFEEFELKLSPTVKWILSLASTGTLPALLMIQAIGLLLFLYWLTPMRMIIKRWKYRWNVGFSRSSYRNDLLTGAAAAVGSGTELGYHFQEVQTYCENRSLRKKAASIAKYEASGISPWVALGKVGLVTDREALALNAMQNDSLRSWALLRMMQRNTDTSRNRTNTAFTVLHPFAIFIFGLFVLGVCFAVFEPLTSLIRSLS